jgi:DNA-binding MarR family transcriptional regulator
MSTRPGASELEPDDDGADDGRDALAARLNSVAIHLVRRSRRADQELGVPPGQLSALSVLVFGGGRTVARLAETEQVTSPTMTRIVDGLERAGLAVRLPHPDDRRAIRVEATDDGRRVMERGRQQRVAVLSAVLGRLSAEELDAVDRASTALAAALRAEQRPTGRSDA